MYRITGPISTDSLFILLDSTIFAEPLSQEYSVYGPEAQEVGDRLVQDHKITPRILHRGPCGSLRTIVVLTIIQATDCCS